MSSTSSESTEFSNDSIHVKVNQQPGCLVAIEISVSPPASKIAYAKAIKEVNKEISIPGFRRGKAPDSTIIQKFSSRIQSEWENILVNTSAAEAFKLINLYPALNETGRPIILKIGVVKISKDENSLVKLEFETLPTIPKIDPSLLTLSTNELQVITEEQCQEKLDELLLNKAEWEELTDKAIEEGDFVDVIIHAIEDENEPDAETESQKDESEEESFRYWVKENKISMDLYQKLIGLRPKEIFDFEDDEKHPVRIEIKKILKPILPQANDELAKSVGASDLTTLKSRIRTTLEIEAKKAQYEAKANELISQLIEKFSMDIPESAIKKHREQIIKRTIDNMKHMMPESSEMERNAAIKRLPKMIGSKSHDILHLRYLVSAYAQENLLTVTNEEFQSELTQLYYRAQAGLQPYLDFSKDIHEIQAEVYDQMITQKVLSSLINRIEKKS